MEVGQVREREKGRGGGTEGGEKSSSLRGVAPSLGMVSSHVTTAGSKFRSPGRCRNVYKPEIHATWWKQQRFHTKYLYQLLEAATFPH